MSAEPTEDKWKMNSHENDPAFSDERWTQFSKQSSTSPSKGSQQQQQTGPSSSHDEASSSLPKVVPGKDSVPEKLSAVQTHTVGTSVTPPATSPEAGVNGVSQSDHSPPAIPPAAAIQAPGTSSAPSGGVQAPANSSATILCQVGEAANGQPLLMAITPEQLAQCGGNPQLLLKGVANNSQSVNSASAGTTQPPQTNGAAPAQPGTGPFTLSQQVLSQPPPKASTPMAAGGGLPTPMAQTPSAVQATTPLAGGMTPIQPMPMAPQRTTNPQAAGLQMVVPPGMQIPIPVPASTMQVKSMVGTPKYQGVNQPQPSPGGPMGMVPFQSVPGGVMTPMGTTPQLLQMPMAGATTPGAMGPGMAAVPMAAIPAMSNGGMMAMQMPPGGNPNQPKLSPMHGGNKPLAPGDGSTAEQAAWAAHSEQNSKEAPKLAEMRSMGSNSRSAEPTPQAGSVRGKSGGERSQGPTPQARDSSKKMSKQEMLLQQLSARDPVSALPPKQSEEGLTEEEKRKRREELEQKLVGKKEDEAALATPMAGAGPSPASTPVAAWKAKPCKTFIQTGTCKYGDKCVFAHGAGAKPASPTTAS